MKVRRIGRRSHDYVSTSRCCCVVTSPTWSWTTSTRRSRRTHSPTTTTTTSTTTTTTCEAAVAAAAAARPRRRRCWRYTLTSADRPSSAALCGWHRAVVSCTVWVALRGGQLHCVGVAWRGTCVCWLLLSQSLTHVDLASH